MAKPKVIVDSRLHIPCKIVDHEYIMDKMTHYEYENEICSKCEFRPIRPCEECKSCSLGGLVSITCLAKYTEHKGKQHIAVPYGELHNFEKLTDLELSDVKFVDRTSKVPHDYKIKFTGSLREYQAGPTADLMDELSGLFIAPPRSGKTVIGTYVACSHGLRTVIMADQKDFLDGFYETIEQMTNLPDLEEKYDKKLFGFPKTEADYKNFQIILVTYQSLIGKSKLASQRMKWLNENYGCLVIDEVHSANAPTFTAVTTAVKMKYRYGLTATKNRKDQLHYRVESTMGPEVARAAVKELVPHVTLHRTPKTVQSRAKYTDKGGYTRFTKFLANHPDRNNYIFDWIIKDLERGRSIAIPVLFTEHAKKLRDRINSHFGEEIAAVFLGGAKEAKKRKPIVDAARAGKIRCVIGTRRLMQRGINIPKWDTLYYIMPMNNKPNWKQESCRILTPMENKKTPVIRMFFDPKMDMSVGFCKSVLKFCWSFGYAKAPKTPRKLRNWLGMTGSEVDDGRQDGSKGRKGEDLPDFFEAPVSGRSFRGAGRKPAAQNREKSGRSFAHWNS